jgi:cell wall-associated NlpC family hydrolase
LLIGVTLLTGVFLALPARELPSSGELRTEYVDGLRRHDGRKYIWGGESLRGVDCSGLIRCGLIDSLFHRGIRTLDPGLVRHALFLWWNDCSAKALGEMHHGLTTRLFDTRSINELDHSQVLPGDLAVTRDGVHIMAYLGNRSWIEADPMEARVVSLAAPNGNLWFATPMTIVRWSLLSR